MKFSLYYKGPLKANGDKKEKHRIRLAIHPQLRKLWTIEPLKTLWEKKLALTLRGDENPHIHKIDKYSFIPLVTKWLDLYVEISIDFLRECSPGDIIQGGDIDNRLKTLFDALRMPNALQEIPEDEEGNEIIYCLLEDDRLITDFQIKTHQILFDCEPDEVILLLNIKTKILKLSYRNMGL